MRLFLAVLVLTGVACAQAPLNLSSIGSPDPAILGSKPADANMSFPGVPSPPKGKAALIGGTIRNLDQVRDRMVIQVFGGHNTSILFDGRTRIFINGHAGSFRDLSQGERVYVETVLDNAAVFARSIHVSTQLPSGESTGQVMDYDSGSGSLTFRDALFAAPVKLRLDSQTAILHPDGGLDHPASAAELQPGALISVSFVSSAGQAMARRISILAEPGAAFVFPGRVVYLDLHTQLMVVKDPRDGKTYDIYCDPAVVHDGLREGADVLVTARFDGTRYAATAITVNAASAK